MHQTSNIKLAHQASSVNPQASGIRHAASSSKHRPENSKHQAWSIRHQTFPPVGCRGGNRYVEGDLLIVGYLVLDDSLGFPYYRLFNVRCFLWIPLFKNRQIWWIYQFLISCFDRYEIRIQAFVPFINGKLIISNPHLHKTIFKICIQFTTKKTKKNIETYGTEDIQFLKQIKML